MRIKVLAALECIDYIMLSEGYTADDIIESVEPDIYVKGAEYAKAEDDITGKIAEEKKLVEKHGGRITSTSLLSKRKQDALQSQPLLPNTLPNIPISLNTPYPLT